MSSPQNPDTQNPINPLPPVIVALFLVIMAVELALSLGARGLVGGPAAVGWRLSAIQTYGFSGEILDWMLANNRWPAQHVQRFVTYPFVHGAFTQALFSGVMLLALGKFVGEVFSQTATLIVFLAGVLGGALAYGVVLEDPMPLLGAFPGVYGLIGGFTFILWARLGVLGANRARAFTLIGFLMGIQLVFGALFGLRSDWLADVAGFAAGFCISFFVAPGGWRQIRARMRHD